MIQILSKTNDNSFLHISQLQVPRNSFTELERYHFINDVYSLTPKHKANLNEHIKFVDRYVVANPSQRLLADQSDCTTRTTRRFIREAEDKNIFKFIRNIYKKNIIIPNPIIFDRKVRIILQKDFTAFGKLPIVKSLINSENVLLTNTKNLNTNNKESNTSDITDSKRENKGLIEVAKVIPLDNYQTTALNEFNSQHLLEALVVLKDYPYVKDKFRFVIKICENRKNNTKPVRYESNRHQDRGYYKKDIQEPKNNRNHSPQTATPSKIDSRSELKINIERLTKEIIESSDPFVKFIKTAALKSLLERLENYEIYNPHEIKKDSSQVKFDINQSEIYVDQAYNFEDEFDE